MGATEENNTENLFVTTRRGHRKFVILFPRGVPMNVEGEKVQLEGKSFSLLKSQSPISMCQNRKKEMSNCPFRRRMKSYIYFFLSRFHYRKPRLIDKIR